MMPLRHIAYAVHHQDTIRVFRHIRIRTSVKPSVPALVFLCTP
jgi:hypothetical protein